MDKWETRGRWFNSGCQRLFVFVALFAFLATARVGAQEAVFPFVLPWDDGAPTAVDLTALNEAAAGDNGFIRVDADGHLADNRGRVRFWGVNLCYGACFPNPAEAEGMACRLAKFGVNLVRCHHLDGWPAPFGIWLPDQPDRTLDPAQLDRLDYLFYCLKARGIYVDLNLLVSRQFHRGANLPAAIDQIADWKVRGALGFFDPILRGLQQSYATDLLAHRNPYTGLTYAQDPAVALVEIINENGLGVLYRYGDLDTLPPYYSTGLNSRWNSWLRDRYADQAALAAAWGAGSFPLGAEQLVNGDFATGSLSPWNLERHGAPSATASASVGAEGPNGSGAVRVAVSSPGQESWHVQINQGGLGLVAGTPYTVTFSARADAPRPLTVEVGMAHSPWQNLGYWQTCALNEAWQTFTATFTLAAGDGNARLNFSGLGQQTGTVWLAGISLRPGGDYGLLPGESLDGSGIGNVLKSAEFTRSPQARRDWWNFLLDTEREYYVAMRRHLKTTLGVKAVVTGTALAWSTPNIQAELDATDTHEYWQHPVFPGIPWSDTDWCVTNTAMANHPESSTLGDAALQGVLGKPHLLSEYNHPHPNTFQAEAFFFLAVGAALQDLDAVIPFAYSHRLGELDARMITSFFDVDQNPVKMASFIPAAAAFRRGDVRPAQSLVAAEVPPATEADHALTGEPWFPEDSRVGFIHRTRLLVNGEASPSGALPPGATPASGPVLAADTGEVGWDLSIPGRGWLTVDTPRTKMLVGFAEGRTALLGAFRFTPGPTLQSGFAAFGLTAVDGHDLDASRRLVLTALGAETNTGAAWYAYPATPTAFPPPEGTLTTWLDALGEAPSRVEGVPLALELPFPPAETWAWSLDERGFRKSALPVTAVGGAARLAVDSTWATLWYEIVRWAGPRGDLDNDGALTAVDLTVLLGCLAGNLPPGVGAFTSPDAAADLDGDRAIDARDAVLLGGALAGKQKARRLEPGP